MEQRRQKRILLLVVFSFFALNLSGSEGDRCGYLTSKILFPDKIPVPIGMAQTTFEKLLLLFASHPAFSCVDAIVLYCSRTHFTHGYRPELESDLDVKIFFRGATDPMEILNLEENANGALGGISKEAGFKVGSQIPAFLTLEEVISSAEKESGLEQAAAIHMELENRGKELGWTRTELKKQVQMKFEGKVVHKEEIILLKASPGAAQRKARLRDIGYENVYILTDLPASPSP